MKKKNSLDYFLDGWHLIFTPGIKRYVLLPMLANIIVMSTLFYWLFIKISSLIDLGLDFVPSWLSWLGYVAVFIVILFFVVFFCYFFSTITNIIAAPFNGLLAEQIEAKLTGKIAPEVSVWELIKDLPRILKRELQKLIYYILWAIPLLLTYFIPLIGQIVTPVVWFIFTAWMINIQYVDYAFDNHKVGFAQMRYLLRQNKGQNIIFGAIVSFFTMIPLVNLLIMPIAVCGATAMWVDYYKKQV